MDAGTIYDLISGNARIPNNIRKAIPHCDYVALFDNSDFDQPFRRVAERVKDSRWKITSDNCPDWVNNMID